tara:strand:- start:16125 stop:16370 length:246 start_codon:yes stop_codon:yes gene_type:complete
MSDQVQQMPSQTNHAVSAEEFAAQQEAMEFNKMAAMCQYNIQRASAIMNALAVGGDVVSSLFNKKDREDLEGKLAVILKKL